MEPKFELSTEAQLEMAKEYIMSNIDRGIEFSILLKGLEVFKSLVELKPEGWEQNLLQGLEMGRGAVEETLNTFTVELHNIGMVLGIISVEELMKEARNLKVLDEEQLQELRKHIESMGRPEEE